MSNDLLLTLPDQSGTLLLIGGSTAQGGFDRATYLFNVAYGSGTGNATGALITSATTTTDASAKGLDIVATANGLGTSTALKLTANGATTENYALEIAAGGIKISSTLPTAVSSTQPLVLEGGVVKIGTGSLHTGTGTANTLPLKLDASKNITSAAIDLTSSTEVTGALPVNRGGSVVTINPTVVEGGKVLCV